MRSTAPKSLNPVLGAGLVLMLVLVHSLPAAADSPLPNTQARNGAIGTDIFLPATGTRVWVFPRDHGQHPRYRLEWWYYTGLLRGAAGERFGYQLTFFRKGLPGASSGAKSSWQARSLYMAHAALSDLTGGRYYSSGLLSRDGPGLAGAALDAHKVWVMAWRAAPLGKEQTGVRLTAATPQFELSLTLQSSTPPVLHGKGGLDRKGPAEGQASWYYSLPRLQTQGMLRVGGQTFAVAGTSWMDHEFGTNQLAPNQVGWDWFALRLSNGYDLMLYRLREKGGASSPYSGGSLITPEGTVLPLVLEQGAPGTVRLEALRHWESSAGGARYPLEWRLVLPNQKLSLHLKPLLDDQELRPGPGIPFAYWEGAISAQGSHQGQPVSAEGYQELTGYGSAPGRLFR